MAGQPDSTTQLQRLLDQMGRGDVAARDDLVQRACGRLLRLTHKMLRRYPAVQRWEQTDDVLQNALLRLHRALAKVQPKTVRGFFKLAAKLIRQELIDLGRHYLGPQGLGANHASNVELGALVPSIDALTRFHELVECLTEDEREVVDLLFYQGMTEREAAAVLGVSDRTVKRRWRSARLALYQELKNQGNLA